MAAQFRLRVIHGPNEGDVFTLPYGRPVVVGRQADLDICLPSKAVSRRHCQIQAEGCGAWGF